MATPAVTQAHFPQGRLFVNPTDGTLASPNTAPFGGTALGLSAEVFLAAAPRTFTLEMEEYGSELGDVVEFPNDWICSVLLAMGDDDNMDTVFGTSGNGATTGDALITEPGITVGSMGSGRAVKLAFVPDDSTMRGFIAYRALPLLDAGHELTYQVQTPGMVGVVFQLMRDANGITLREGRPADLIP